MFDLTGKKALVTGASGAIGAAIAKALHQQGAHLALSGTRIEALEALKQELCDNCRVVQCNLSDNAGVDRLFSKAEELMGQIDIVVNNAGITRDGLLMRMKDEDWQQVLQVNLESVFRICRGAVKGMMKRRWGRIINISSVVGVTGNPGQANYVSAKAGMIGLTKSIAQEVANRGITVNAVAPGFIATPMTEKLTPEQSEAILQKIPMGRMGKAIDIAAAVAFLASEEASYISGQTMHVNGGMAMI